jgi:hypothetical protein
MGGRPHRLPSLRTRLMPERTRSAMIERSTALGQVRPGGN